jgi:predicted DNA-binding transcriptional regulator
MTKSQLTPEELENLKNVQNQLNVLTFKLGDVEIQQLTLNENKNMILEELRQLKQSQKDLGNRLVEKYGNGRIDLESGEHIKD